MILLDGIENETEDSIVCSVTLHAGSPFAENGRVPVLVATEYMAQCVAAHAGLRAFRRCTPIRIGYLIGARRIDFSIPAFVVPETLIVRATRVWGDDSLGQYRCSVELAGHPVSTAVLNVFQGDIDQRSGQREVAL